MYFISRYAFSIIKLKNFLCSKFKLGKKFREIEVRNGERDFKATRRISAAGNLKYHIICVSSTEKSTIICL